MFKIVSTKKYKIVPIDEFYGLENARKDRDYMLRHRGFIMHIRQNLRKLLRVTQNHKGLNPFTKILKETEEYMSIAFWGCKSCDDDDYFCVDDMYKRNGGFWTNV